MGDVPYWDGGYLGNPALSPLLDYAQDLLLVLVNPFQRDAMPPRTAPGILDRLNEITFNPYYRSEEIVMGSGNNELKKILAKL